MIELTEPQVWVLVGVFTTAVFGMLSWQTISFNRTLTAAIGTVNAKIDGLHEATDAKFDRVDAKFELLNSKIDSLDGDVQALTRHFFGPDPR